MISNHLSLGKKSATSAIQKHERGVQLPDTPAFFQNLDKIRWDDLNLFSVVARQKSLRAASKHVGLSVNALRYRIARLEEALETSLLLRTHEGLQLTPEGEAALGLAQDMAQLGSERRVAADKDAHVAGPMKIRIATSEGIGALWLTPQLAELRARLPQGTSIRMSNLSDVECATTTDHSLRLSFVKPSSPDLIVTKLGTIHFTLWAAHDYFSERGYPRNIRDTAGHCYVDQDSPGLQYNIADMFVGPEALERLTTYTVNSSFALYWAVLNGLGIGALPTYVAAFSNNLAPIGFAPRLQFPLWLSFEKSAKPSAALRTTISWLREMFDHEEYPWFSDHFQLPGLLSSDEESQPAFLQLAGPEETDAVLQSSLDSFDKL
jgi:DNA-binding transcriptional LysR family regulator